VSCTWIQAGKVYSLVFIRCVCAVDGVVSCTWIYPADLCLITAAGNIFKATFILLKK
jgi:hypothetical protein